MSSDGPYAVVLLMNFISLFTGKMIWRDPNSLSAQGKRLSAKAGNSTGRFSVNGVSYALEDKALREFDKYRSEYINKNMTKLINTSRYKNMSDNDKKNALKNLYADASTYAKNT
jgi:hypothetical protein